MRHAVVAIVLAALLPLSACGGGNDPGKPVTSDGDQPAPPDQSLQEFLGLGPALEIPQHQLARAPSIFEQSNSLILSTYYEPDSPAFSTLTECSGDSCTLTDAEDGESYPFHLSGLEFFVSAQAEAIGSKDGITLMWQTTEAVYEDESESYYYLGAWMEHSTFAVVGGGESSDYDIRLGLAVGHLTGTRPTGSATWNGIMVGRSLAGTHSGHYLAGNATLTYDPNASEIDATFGDIKDIARRTAHSTQTVRFLDVPVDLDGTFKTGNAGNRLQGGFYGHGHAEAAGIFEQSNIVGAFGAKRQ